MQLLLSLARAGTIMQGQKLTPTTLSLLGCQTLLASPNWAYTLPISSVLWHRACSRTLNLYCHNFHRANTVKNRTSARWSKSSSSQKEPRGRVFPLSPARETLEHLSAGLTLVLVTFSLILLFPAPSGKIHLYSFYRSHWWYDPTRCTKNPNGMSKHIKGSREKVRNTESLREEWRHYLNFLHCCAFLYGVCREETNEHKIFLLS